jgi:hypothetical protein
MSGLRSGSFLSKADDSESTKFLQRGELFFNDIPIGDSLRPAVVVPSPAGFRACQKTRPIRTLSDDGNQDVTGSWLRPWNQDHLHRAISRQRGPPTALKPGSLQLQPENAISTGPHLFKSLQTTLQFAPIRSTSFCVDAKKFVDIVRNPGLLNHVFTADFACSDVPCAHSGGCMKLDGTERAVISRTEDMNKYCVGSALRKRAGLILCALVVWMLMPLRLAAQDGQKTNPPPFDFTDQFYVDHGINPANILQRVGTSTNNSLNWAICQPGDAAPCPNTDQDRNQTQVLQTTSGFAFDGSILFYSIMGFVTPSTFNTDSSGDDARQIANRRMAFIFPKQQSDGTYILSPALGNRRQDNLFDTSGGYLGEDPLGLWILEFVELTPFGASPAGQQILAPFAQMNGVGTDGTPVINTLSDINSLVQQGVFQLVTRNLDGSQGFPWVI